MNTHPKTSSRIRNQLGALVARQWFLLGLLGALVLGAAGSRTIAGILDRPEWTGAIVFGVMFLMAMPLRTDDLWQTVRRPGPPLLGTLVCYGIVPLLALAARPWLDPPMAAGLLVVSAIPVTLASATVWTARAGGNEAAALMTTVITNASCFLLTPLVVWWTLGQVAEVSPTEMSRRLLVLVVVPIGLAQLLRRHPGIARWATSSKSLLNIVAQIGILVLVVAGTARSWQNILPGEMPRWNSLLLTAVVCLAVHLGALIAGWILAGRLGMSRADQIAVAIAGSQKTMAVGLIICLMLDVTLIPLVIYHAVQLVADTWLADWLARNAADDGLPEVGSGQSAGKSANQP